MYLRTTPFLVLLLLCSMSCGSGWSEVDEWIPLTIGDSIAFADDELPVVTDAFLLDDNEIAVFDYSRGSLRVHSFDGSSTGFIAGGSAGGAGVYWLLDAAAYSTGGFLLSDMDTQELVRCSETGERTGSSGSWPGTLPHGITTVNEEMFAGIQLEYQLDQVVFRINLYGLDDYTKLCCLTSDSMAMEDFESQNRSVIHTLETLHMASNGSDLICYTRSSTEDYLVQAFGIDGSETCRISLPLESAEKSQQELAEEEYFAGNTTLSGTADINRNRFIVVGIEIDGEDNIWVQRGTESAPVFDVFSKEGEYITTGSFPMEGQYWRFSFAGSQALAWEWNPSEGSDTIFLLELPEIRATSQ